MALWPRVQVTCLLGCGSLEGRWEKWPCLPPSLVGGRSAGPGGRERRAGILSSARASGARGRRLTRSLALFTLMTLAASERPVDFSVHLWTWPNRPLQTRRHSRLRAHEARPDAAGMPMPRAFWSQPSSLHARVPVPSPSPTQAA